MKRYPAYKDSGVDWLCEVPEGWEISKIRYVARFLSGGTPSRDNPAFWNGDIPWVSPKDMKSRLISTAEEGITEEGLSGSASTLTAPNSVLMVVRSGILKHTIPVAMNIVPVALNQDIKAITFEPDRMQPNYFVYFVEGHNDALLLAWSKQGATVESIEHQYLTETPIPLPPLPEQQAIAGFLDREVGKIDALVQEQRRLIALLAEKRQAVISHAVTRGLNPTTPLKPSGIDWLGDIPEGWEVVKLGRVTSKIVDGAHFTPTYVTDGVPFLRVTDITSGHPDLGAVARIPESEHIDLIKRCDPRLGDLLLSKNGTIGVPCVVTWDWDFSIFVSLCLIRPTTRMNVNFLRYVFLSKEIKMQIEADSKQSTVINLHLDKISGFMLPLPLYDEQAEIVAYLDTQTTQLDSLTAAATSAIALLQERRAALISAAVTGKIDLRDISSQSLSEPEHA